MNVCAKTGHDIAHKDSSLTGALPPNRRVSRRLNLTSRLMGRLVVQLEVPGYRALEDPKRNQNLGQARRI